MNSRADVGVGSPAPNPECKTGTLAQKQEVLDDHHDYDDDDGGTKSSFSLSKKSELIDFPAYCGSLSGVYKGSGSETARLHWLRRLAKISIIFIVFIDHHSRTSEKSKV